MRFLLNFSNERFIYLFLDALRIASQKSKISQLYTEYKIYPKKPKRLYPINTNTDNLNIIIQGPIEDFDFVQNSIDWYHSCGVKK